MCDKSINLLDFIIANSSSRVRRYGLPISMQCEESIAIFDELDSLDAEEFSIVYAIYLIGKGEESERDNALLRVKSAGFSPLEAMAFDEELHLVLSMGKREWQKVSSKSVFEISVGFGVGSFVLGKTKAEIRMAAGEPDAIEAIPELEGTEVWRYLGLHLSMTFSRNEEWRLTSLDCEGREHTLSGIAFIGKHEMELITLAPLIGIDDLICDGDYEENGKCFTSKNSALMFWVVENIVVNLSVMLLYDQTGDMPLWPK